MKTYVLPTCHVHTEKHIYTMYTQNEEHSVYLKKNSTNLYTSLIKTQIGQLKFRY